MEPTVKARRAPAQPTAFPGPEPTKTVYGVEQSGAGWVLKEYSVPVGQLERLERKDRRTIPDLLGIILNKLEERLYRADGIWRK